MIDQEDNSSAILELKLLGLADMCILKFVFHYFCILSVFYNFSSFLYDFLELPGKVRNISHTSKEANGLVLSWLPPINWSHANVSYKVTCKVYCIKPNCPQRCSKLEFIPSFDNLLQTNVTVKGFGDDAERYLFTIFTKDHSHDVSEDIWQVKWNFNAINYTGEHLGWLDVMHCGASTNTNYLEWLHVRDLPDTTLPDTGFNRIVIYQMPEILD